VGGKVKQGKQEVFVPDLSMAVAAPVLIATGGIRRWLKVGMGFRHFLSLTITNLIVSIKPKAF